jgi:hypothetical protein
MLGEVCTDNPRMSGNTRSEILTAVSGGQKRRSKYSCMESSYEYVCIKMHRGLPTRGCPSGRFGKIANISSLLKP